MTSHLIHTQSSILDGLTKLNNLSGGIMTLFVVDDDNKVLGSLTDGDIRRALISGAQLSDSVVSVMHPNFRCLKGDDIDVASIKEMRDVGIRLIPWLNADGSLRRVVDISNGRTLLPLSAVLMAGGKGERLRPLTLNTPKPLLKIGGKAIIDYNIDALVKCGITNITVTTNYLANQIERHFEVPVDGVRVRCVKEDKPLGTVGAVALADIPEYGSTLVMNSDLLTTISFEDMYLHHLATNADVTVAVVPYQVAVPFAILTTDDADPERVTGIEEKPSYSYFANAGIYIFSNALLHRLDSDTRTDATDLIDTAIADGLRVTEFPINGTWIDVGSPTDFRQATELIKYVQKANF